jgi:acyl-CoA thioesterase-1
MKKAVPALGLIITLMLLSLTIYGQEESSVQTERKNEHAGIIVAFGDSLTAGAGVAENEAYPAQLERKLNADGHHYKVINAGVSGETSSGALSRIKWVLTMKPDIVILETGANDGLRGVNPELTRNNLDAIVAALKEHGVVVVLAGMRMASNLGREYTEKFAAMYPFVAAKHQVILMPFFLAGVAGDPNLNQQDGIHPTAKGYEIVTANIYPYVVNAVKQR